MSSPRTHVLRMISGLADCAGTKLVLVDADSRSMATSGRGSGVVGNNVQVAVTRSII
jgi:hypothetical protein